MARSSSYGNYLNRLGGLSTKMPGWVMGSDYGDLQTQLANADLAQSRADSADVQAAIAQMSLDQARDKGVYEDLLTDQIRSQGPQTLRDAYAIALGAAKDSGSAEDIMSMMDKIERIDREQRFGKFKQIEEAAQLGRIDPKLADEYLQAAGVDYKIPPKAFQRAQGELKPFYNEKMGDWEWVGPRDYARQEQLLRGGYIPGLSKKPTDPLKDYLLQELGIENPGAQPTEQQQELSQDFLERYNSGVVTDQVEIRPGPNGQPIRVMKNPTSKGR